jgi:iron(III) transport system permease protein
MATNLDALPAAAPTAAGRLRQRIRLLEPSMILWIVLIAVLVFLVASPIVRLVVSSFQEAETGRLTLANYAEAYGRPRHLQALVNSLPPRRRRRPARRAVRRADRLGDLAHRHARQGLRTHHGLRRLHHPPYLGAVGWILLAGPNAGWINKVWIGLTGASTGIVNVYSMTGLIVVIAVTSFPYVFVFVNSALDLVSSEMEDAANILGAARCGRPSGSRCRWYFRPLSAG